MGRQGISWIKRGAERRTDLEDGAQEVAGREALHVWQLALTVAAQQPHGLRGPGLLLQKELEL